MRLQTYFSPRSANIASNAWCHLLLVFDLVDLAVRLLRDDKNICHSSWPNSIDKCSVMLVIITTAEFSAIYRDDMWNFADEKKAQKNAMLFFFVLIQIKGLDFRVIMDIERWMNKKNSLAFLVQQHMSQYNFPSPSAQHSADNRTI